MSRYEEIKVMIELAPSFEKADLIMNEYTEFKTVEEKIAFLKGMFYVEVVAETADADKQDTYCALLTTIVEDKFRC